MKAAMIGMLLLGVVLILAPIGAGIGHIPLTGGIGFLMLILGGVLVAVAGSILIFTQLYMRARPDMAFVRTGLGGSKVIQNGGALVIPVVHEVVEVSLAAMRLAVEREDKSALLTLDKLRANVRAEFYVHVDPSTEGLTAAARSLGNKSADADQIMTLVEDKLVNALRSVAAKMTLEDLNTERDKFVKDVMDHVTSDLNHNGLKLESVTISHLDQAPHTSLDENNVFDAQGLRTIAEKTQEQLTAKNQLIRNGERTRLQQDVANRQASLDLQKTQSEAEAKQASDVAQIRAQNDQNSKQAAIRAEQQVKQSTIESDQILAIKAQEKEQATEVAKQAKEQAVSIAQQAKERAVALAVKEKDQEVAVATQNAEKATELASRDREIAIAEQNTKLAVAEQLRLEAEKARTTTEQAVQTVTAVETARREQQTAVITAEGVAQQAYVKTQKEADGEAYRIQKTAEGKKAAADADAEAIRKNADAQSDAMTRRAAGEQALALVPINVKKQEVEIQRVAAEIPVDIARKQVDVDQAKVAVKQKEVEVLTQELEARAKSGEVAQNFELTKLRITTEGQVRIETARAAATFGQKFEGTFVGTPDQLATLQQSLFKGMGIAQLAESTISNLGPETRSIISAIGGTVGDAVTALAAGKKDAPKNGASPTA